MTGSERIAALAEAATRCAFAEFESPYPDDVVYAFTLACEPVDHTVMSCFLTEVGLTRAVERFLYGKQSEVHPLTWATVRRGIALVPADSEFDQLLDARCLGPLNAAIEELEATISRDTLVPASLEMALAQCRDLGLGTRVLCHVFAPDEPWADAEARLRRLNAPDLLERLDLQER